jgi:two-component system response regulator AtoC
MDYTLIGNHPSIRKIRELITMVSDTSFNVLLLGETGTGKEVIARLLHRSSSSRSKKRFVKVNCAALPLTLLESELFGYEKGAFTGADRRKPGKFELASEGVMFLDEIGDMPLPLQAKLLQVLQSGEFNRLGGTEDIKANAWVISSTNHDLERDMAKHLFREDLYYRLNIIKIELPPLRERREDIGLLTGHLIKKHGRELGLDEGINLNSDLGRLFQSYPWPGNVRELSSTILRLMVGDDPDLVKSELMNNTGTGSPTLPRDQTSEASGEREKPDILKPLREVKAEAIKYIEKEAILHALRTSRWNKREAAKILKISYKSLFIKIREYGIASELSAN